jgi:hypothetical protein
MQYAYERIEEEEYLGRCKLSQFEKNRLVIQYLKLNEGVRLNSRVKKQKRTSKYNPRTLLQQ